MTPQAISHWDKVFTLEEFVVLGVPYLSVDDTVVTKQPSFWNVVGQDSRLWRGVRAVPLLYTVLDCGRSIRLQYQHFVPVSIQDSYQLKYYLLSIVQAVRFFSRQN